MEESHRDGDSASGEPAADRMPSFKNILQKRHLKRFLKLKHSVSFFFFFFFFIRNATRTAGGQQMEAGLDSEPAVGISWPYFQGSSLYIETN